MTGVRVTSLYATVDGPVVSLKNMIEMALLETAHEILGNVIDSKSLSKSWERKHMLIIQF